MNEYETVARRIANLKDKVLQFRRMKERARDPDTIILKLTVKRDIDGTISIENREHIPCACTGVAGGNNYQPYPYEEGSEQYTRTLSKIDGTFDGPNLTIGYQYNFSEY